MQKLQRKMVVLPRATDDAQVGVLVGEFEEGDKLLKTVFALLHGSSSPV